MSETKSLAAPKASFDRRAVVKGAAWSVPVIAAAIAAPAAAASAKSATAGFVAGGVSYSALTSGSAPRTGTGLTSFYIQNTSGTIVGTISGTIRISPTLAAKKDPGVGITTASFTGATLQNPVLSDPNAGPDSGTNVFTASFNHTGTVDSNAKLSFPVGFYYRGATDSPSRNFTMTVTMTLPGRTTALVVTAPLSLA